MAKTLKLTLTPLEPYFFGGERSFAFGEQLVSQRAKQNPYYISSERLPAQTALLGVLRYLGIRSPGADFGLTAEDKANIGGSSYQLTGSGDRQGRILRLSPLVLEGEGRVLIPVPKDHMPCREEDAVPDTVPAEYPFAPYRSFTAVAASTRGACLLPDGYSDKDEDQAQFLAFDADQPDSAPVVLGGMFETRMQVGINRSMQKEDRPGGFFKREYVKLRDGYSFVFYAQTEDDFFWRSDDHYVTMGQAKSGFRCTVEEVTGEWEQLIPYAAALKALPAENLKNPEEKLCYLYAASDLCYTGSISELKAACSLMLASARSHRSLVTVGGNNTAKRYRKQPQLLQLIEAGSVFVFTGAEQRKAFLDKLQEDKRKEHYQVVGYNRIVEIKEEPR